jgi:hypothetical protein
MEYKAATDELLYACVCGSVFSSPIVAMQQVSEDFPVAIKNFCRRSFVCCWCRLIFGFVFEISMCVVGNKI